MKHLRIVLTGFMATGKTAVGEKLAKKLKYDFLDTDLMVEGETGKSITQIFEKEGEPAFRAYEKKMIKKAMERENVVVATGGGAIVDPDNLKLIKTRGFVIGLSASPESIMQRISRMDTRPLLQAKDTKEQLKKIEALLSHRSPYYRKADKIIDTTMKQPDETVTEILKALNEND